MTNISKNVIRLNASDNVVVATLSLTKGLPVPEEDLVTKEPIESGHKLATKNISKGDGILKYNQIIGFAKNDIQQGDHVHTHNVVMEDFIRDYQFCESYRKVDIVPENNRSTFRGYVRGSGKVGTRNYIGILTSVNCSASVARCIASEFTKEALAEFPNVDGVVALTHDYGCGGCAGIGLNYIQRTLSGYAEHPNFYSVLIVGLGCEQNQIGRMMDAQQLSQSEQLQTYTIQEAGGTRAAIAQGVEAVQKLLPSANRVRREERSATDLTLALQCGGSDGYSGISANPALGAAVDLLVKNGGTACLGETPEIYGAENLLIRRAVSKKVGGKLLEHIEWWKEYTHNNHAELNNNPTAGNNAGGITTVIEKSLGGVTKGGTTGLMNVYNYAEPITSQGLVFMNTPGYDPVSVTGMVAGGANITCFTTGRGSVYGGKPVPSLKLATNSAMYQRMQEDMDINCGRIVDGTSTVKELGNEIFQQILACASGERSKSEILGIGEEEFVPWTVGAIL